MSSNADRLADAVRRRREQLQLTQLEVWQSGGPSNTTLTKIENGQQETLPRSTARKLDLALQWGDGTAKTIWDGGKSAGIPPEVLEEVERLSPSVREYVLHALTQSTLPPPRPEVGETG